MGTIQIGAQPVGPEHPPYFIADIASNHDGDLQRAFSLIELAKEAGAHAAKFQNFKAPTIVSKTGFDQLGNGISHQKAWKKSVFEVYEDASVPDEWSLRLKEQCDTVGIEYMTSPYDFSSVDLADAYVNCFKIGSGDITWTQILEHIAKKKKPVLLATGASSLEDVDRAVETIRRHTSQIVLMQCNTNYTGSPENFRYVNLNVLKTYAARYPDFVLGLSDHTPGHETVLGAVALGARVIEKHFTDDTGRAGPDHAFSMTPQTWKEMVERAGNLFLSLGDGVKRIEPNEQETACIQRRALYYRDNFPAGKILSQEDLIPLRPIPQEGIPPYAAVQVAGRQLRWDVKKDTAVKWEDIQSC